MLSLNKKPKLNDVCVPFKNSNFCSRMLKMYSKRSRFQKFPGGGGACAWDTPETGVSFFLITHDYTFIANKSKIKPKRPLNCSISPLACKHTHFSLLIAAGGHFARRNFCDSATKNSIMIM